MAVGVPAFHFQEPWSPEIERLVADYVRNERHSLLLCSKLRAEQPQSKNPRALGVHHQALIGARLCCGSSQKAADFLNEGVSYRSHEKGLTRDHVHRARRKYLGLPDPTQLMVHAELTLFIGHFKTLEIVRRLAKDRPEYRKLRGRDLAEAIDDRHDLPEVMYQASAKLSPRLFPLFEAEARASTA